MSDTNNHHPTPVLSSRPLKEIREDLLHGIEDKGAHDVLQALPPARLGRALIQATVGCVALLALLTIGPYLLEKYVFASDKAANGKVAEKKEKPSDKADKKPDADKKPAADKVASDPKKDAKPSRDALDKLKENEVKKDKPKDPVGGNIDDLIDKK